LRLSFTLPNSPTNLLAKLREVISKGQEIVAKVIKVDQEYKKISLSIKEYLVEKIKKITMTS
jgi:ribosomal protein S1